MIESNQAEVEEVLRSYQTFTLLKVLALKYTYSINCKMTCYADLPISEK